MSGDSNQDKEGMLMMKGRPCDYFILIVEVRLLVYSMLIVKLVGEDSNQDREGMLMMKGRPCDYFILIVEVRLLVGLQYS
jgi:hypothetical protein